MRGTEARQTAREAVLVHIGVWLAPIALARPAPFPAVAVLGIIGVARLRGAPCSKPEAIDGRAVNGRTLDRPVTVLLALPIISRSFSGQVP